MSAHGAILLFAATFIFVMTPGPGIFALVGRALSRGPLSGFVLSLGLISADTIYLTFAIVGLSYVATRLHPLFVAVKIVGALYLVWLGVQAWRAPAETLAASAAGNRSLWRDYIGGFLTSASNPKVILFYLGFLPAFIDLQHISLARYVQIVAIICATLLSGCLVYLFLCARMRQVFTSTRAVRYLNRISAVVLIGVGAVVAGS